MLRSRAALPGLALAVLSLVWGYNWVVSKIALGYAGPITFAALRFAIAPLCLVPMMLHRGTRLLPSPRHALIATVLGVVLAANFAATFIALRIGGTGKTAMLVYTMPFWVLVLARIALKERLTTMQVPAVMFALAGLTALIAPWNRGAAIAPSLLAAGSGFSWAASVVYLKHLQHREEVSMLEQNFWQMLVAAAALGIAGVLSPEVAVRWHPTFVVALLFTAVVATGLGWMLFFYALRKLSAGMAGLGTLATPVIGVLSAWVQLGERPGSAEAVGMGLIAAGLGLLAWDGVSARSRSGPPPSGPVDINGRSRAALRRR
jgi:drug/metabolite transporter (DMT)-like permease